MFERLKKRLEDFRLGPEQVYSEHVPTEYVDCKLVLEGREWLYTAVYSYTIYIRHKSGLERREYYALANIPVGFVELGRPDMARLMRISLGDTYDPDWQKSVERYIRAAVYAKIGVNDVSD